MRHLVPLRPNLIDSDSCYSIPGFISLFSCADKLQEAELKQLLFEKSTLLVNAVADATSLRISLASKGQEVMALLNQQRKCEIERQRLHRDLKEANSFKERIFATINHAGPAHSPPTDSLVSVIDITGPVDENSALLALEQI